jgi:hypothetical protein
MKSEKVQYHFDTFTDEFGTHNLTLCAVSRELPTKLSEVDPGVSKDEDTDLRYFVVVDDDECYVDDITCGITKELKIGWALQNPGDSYDKELGMRIAYNRACDSDDGIYTTKKGYINTVMVSALLQQEAEYIKSNPDSIIRNYKERMKKCTCQVKKIIKDEFTKYK